MPPLRLDYLRPPPGRQWPGWLVLTAGLLGCGFLLVQSASISRQLPVVEQEVYKLRHETERRRMLAQAEGQGQDQLAQRQSVRQTSPLNVRWTSLLIALEESADDSVTLLGLEPGLRDIAIVGEARDMSALLDYIKRLQAAAVFAEVYLIRHETMLENPYRPVQFSLQATWREVSQ